jgi:hypothetical protein
MMEALCGLIAQAFSTKYTARRFRRADLPGENDVEGKRI